MSSPTRMDLISAKNVLAQRRGNTADEAEKAVIDSALDELNDAIEAIDQVALLQKAGLVARAADALERVVASARMGPFDNFLTDIQAALKGLQARIDEMQASERLPPAPLASTDVQAPAAAITSTPAAPAAAGGGTTPPAAPLLNGTADEPPAPINGRDFDNLRDEYAEFFDRCRLRPEFEANLNFYVSRLLKHKQIYAQRGSSLGIPWALIGILHGMECGFNFGTHLHNGDPLTGPTKRVPKGRPEPVQRSFTWLESANDALQMKGLHKITDWSLPRLLFQLEAYNGFGYRPRGIPTPYLWSFSNLYRSGKFVADHEFDPNAVSKQCGAAVMLRGLQEAGAV